MACACFRNTPDPYTCTIPLFPKQQYVPIPPLPPVFGCLQYAKMEERFGNDARDEGLGKAKLNIVAYCKIECMFMFYRIWDIECGACLKLLEGHDDLVR